MNDLASISAVPQGWSFLDTTYNPGLSEAEHKNLETLLKCIASGKACLEIKRFSIPDAPLVDAISLGSLVRLLPTTCVERSEWLVRHEAIHVIKSLQLLDTKEWEFLNLKAYQLGWLSKFKIIQRYRNLSSDTKAEEAIADAFAFWCEQRPTTASAKQRMSERVRIFWQNCANFFLGYGFLSVDGIFLAISSGVVAKRRCNQRRGPVCARLASYIMDYSSCLSEPQQV